MHPIIGAETPRVWVWRKLLRHGRLTSNQLHDLWSRSREALSKWKSDPFILDEALKGLRCDSMIACTNGTWWIRDPA